MSAQYPGAAWSGPARWFTYGRDGKSPRLVVIHYTAGAEGRTAAENGAAYDRRRPDKVSTHFFVDADSVVQEVRLEDTAYAAYGKGNRLGVQIELCGTVQTRGQWLDATSLATLQRGAQLTAWLCQRYGLAPRRLTLPEVRAAWDRFPNGPAGIVGHVDCTYGYGQGDHTDPGAQFPWDVFEGFVRSSIGPATIGGDMINVLRVNEADGTPAWYAAAGGKVVGIPHGGALEAWRRRMAAVGGREIELTDAQFADVLDGLREAAAAS